MKIRAKFRCVSITHRSGGSEAVDLVPVYGDTNENKTWSKYTPSGKCELAITQEGAQGAFEVDKEYFLDFTPAT